MTSDEGRKLDRLRAIVRGYGSALVAFSGGADSALVLKVAADELGERARALTAVSPTMARREKARAVTFAAGLGVALDVIESHELERPGFKMNPTDRCYHCKAELLDLAQPHADKLGLATVLLGTNVDDLGDHRPGLDAARAAGIVAPLVDVGMRKSDIRHHAHAIGLGVWDKPAAACLSSRLPYGTAVTRERLSQIGGLEADLKALGFRQLRVRWHDKVARIEIDVAEIAHAVDPSIRTQMVAAGKRHGFAYVTLDLQGYRQGSHNELLAGNALRIVS